MTRKSAHPSSFFAWVTAVFDPGSQAVGVVDRCANVPLQIGHDVPGTLRGERLVIGREMIVPNPATLPKDEFANVASLSVFIRENALKGSKVSCIAHAGLGASRRHD